MQFGIMLLERWKPEAHTPSVLYFSVIQITSGLAGWWHKGDVIVAGWERSVATVVASQDIAQLLSKSLLFGALDESARRELAGHARCQSFNSGETIVHVGAPGHSMMVILNGTVRVSLLGPRGKGIILADLPPGELLGEVALLDGKERSADATALTKCELVVLERRDVLPFLERRPDVCLKLLELMCARLRKSDQRMSDIAFLELPVRLAKVLLDRIGLASRTGAKPKLSLSQTELAGMIHATRENVNRCLGLWQRQGIVDLDEGELIILQRDSLGAIAGYS
jgi:CRP/FNR family transcriptional regulator, cyclic AMP receptor protein